MAYASTFRAISCSAECTMIFSRVRAMRSQNPIAIVATARRRFDPTRIDLRVINCPYERTSGWSSKASEAELKGNAVCRD